MCIYISHKTEICHFAYIIIIIMNHDSASQGMSRWGLPHRESVLGAEG